MRRAVILATLAFLLLAVAGVTVAQEDTLAPEPDSTGVAETTIPESTLGEATVPEDSDEPVTDAGEATGITEDVEELAEEDEPATTKPGKGKPEGAGKPDGIGKPESAGNPDNPGKPAGKGKPDGVGKPEGVGRPDNLGKPVGKGKPEGAGGPVGKGQPMVTLCHKDRVTITVAAPAEPAHLRHGDSLGAC